MVERVRKLAANTRGICACIGAAQKDARKRTAHERHGVDLNLRFRVRALYADDALHSAASEQSPDERNDE